MSIAKRRNLGNHHEVIVEGIPLHGLLSLRNCSQLVKHQKPLKKLSGFSKGNLLSPKNISRKEIFVFRNIKKKLRT